MEYNRGRLDYIRICTEKKTSINKPMFLRQSTMDPTKMTYVFDRLYNLLFHLYLFKSKMYEGLPC